MAFHSSSDTVSDAAELAAPATQFIDDRDSYLGQGQRELGRRVSATELELFVVGDAAIALQQQLVEHAPDYIALNDVAGHAADGLLQALAASTRTPLQTLTFRRQGQGMALAELQFIELPTAPEQPGVGGRKSDANGPSNAPKVRIFGAEVNADSRTRQQVSQLLMAHSRLAVLLVGELPRHSIPPALAPWRDAIHKGPWSNGDLLVVPLAEMPTLGMAAAQLAGRSGVNVELVSVPKSAAEAFAALLDAWNRLQLRQQGQALLSARALHAEPAGHHTPEPTWAQATVPMGLENAQAAVPKQEVAAPVAAVAAVAAAPIAPRPITEMPVPGGTRWDDYTRRVAALRGAVACGVFDEHTQQNLADAGGRPTGERLAVQGALLVKAMAEAGRAIGVGPVLREATLSLGRYQLLLVPMAGHSGLWLHLVIDSQVTSAAVLRAMVEQLKP
jgi:hypothetical protein